MKHVIFNWFVLLKPLLHWTDMYCQFLVGEMSNFDLLSGGRISCVHSDIICNYIWACAGKEVPVCL